MNNDAKDNAGNTASDYAHAGFDQDTKDVFTIYESEW